MINPRTLSSQRGAWNWLIVALVCAPTAAWANAALPFLGRLAIEAMPSVFVLIVALETLVVWRVLEVHPLQALAVVLFGNTLTTFIGVPMTSILGGLVVYFSVGLSTAEELEPWFNLAALIPFFLVSWGVEGLVLRAGLPKELGRERIFQASFEANRLSYIALAGFFVLLDLQF